MAASETDRQSVSQTDRQSILKSDSMWSSAKSRANHHLISAHQTPVSCREEEEEGGDERGWNGGLIVFSSPSFQLVFCLINMQLASSPHIPPPSWGGGSSYPSASWTVVPERQGGRLRMKTTRTKRYSFVSLLVFASLSPCPSKMVRLHPSVSFSLCLYIPLHLSVPPVV